MVLRQIFFIASTLLVVGCGSSSETSEDSGSIEKPAPNGEQLFLQNCVACHGVDGTAEKSGSKDLSKSTITYKEIRNMIELGGGNGMPRFKEILGGDSELDAVAEHVMQLRKRI